MEHLQDKKLYEVHDLEGKQLPIVFHYNIVQIGGSEIANWHNNIEFLYCNVGSGQILCNSIVYDVNEGDLIVVNSGLLHVVRKTKSFEYYCLIVDSDFLATNGIMVNEMEFETFVRSEETSALFCRVVDEIEHNREFRATGVRSRILDLMVHLSRKHLLRFSSTANPRMVSDQNIKEAISYIKSNCAQRLSLEEIAGAVNLSKYHFAREFKKATGMTVVAYINEIRCRNARRLILSKQHSISEVASLCGFENNSYFSKTFKQVMGCLPSEITKAP